LRYEEHRELIAEIADGNGVPLATIEELLALEPRYLNLGQPNARRQLQSEVADILGRAYRVAAGDDR
jgi:hypothetical protein